MSGSLREGKKLRSGERRNESHIGGKEGDPEASRVAMLGPKDVSHLGVILRETQTERRPHCNPVREIGLLDQSINTKMDQDTPGHSTTERAKIADMQADHPVIKMTDRRSQGRR